MLSVMKAKRRLRLVDSSRSLLASAVAHRITRPRVTMGPRTPMRSETVPQVTLVTRRIQAPMEVMALAWRRSKPNETTSEGA